MLLNIILVSIQKTGIVKHLTKIKYLFTFIVNQK